MILNFPRFQVGKVLKFREDFLIARNIKFGILFVEGRGDDCVQAFAVLCVLLREQTSKSNVSTAAISRIINNRKTRIENRNGN